MYKRNAQGWSKHMDFIIVDEISLQLAFLLAAGIYLKIRVYASTPYRAYVVLLLLADAVVAVMLNSFHNVLKRGYWKEAIATLKHCLTVFAIMAVFMFATQSGITYSRMTLFLTLIFHLVIGYITRILWKQVARRYGENKRARQSMLVVLEDATAEQMMERLKANAMEGYDIVGAVVRGETDRQEICGVPVVSTIEETASYICRKWIDEVYIDCPATEPDVAKLMDDCSQMGVPVHYHVPAVSRQGTKRFAEIIGGTTVLTTSINYVTPIQLFVKRLFDILGGIVGSVIALLIMLVIGPIIKIKSPGPILYTQMRIGKNGKPFKLYKIRSMHLGADEKKEALMAQNRVKDGLMFKLDFDPRIIGNEVLPDGTQKTGIGEFIRKTSLDEFPQFFNVLAGQMSLVGTRPPTLDEWEKYELHHRARMSVKPGITGMWQVSGRSTIVDFEEVVRLDTEYILNWSYGLDLKILLKTVAVVLARSGAM